MPATYHRPSSTKGKHIVLSSPALPKGEACTQCKHRKVRCDGARPGCWSCKRTARFNGQDEGSVVCCYDGVKCGPRRPRSRKTSGDSQQERQPSDVKSEDGSLANISALATEPFGDWSSVPSSRLAFSYTTRFDSIDSAFSSEAPSSASGSFDILPSSSNSPNSFPSVDYTLPDLYFPQQAISTSPLSMLDSTDYFSAYLFAPSTSIDAPPTIPSDLSKGITYPSCDFDLLSLFPASQPAPKVVKHEPSYFGMPPPIEKQEWPQEMKSGGGLEVVGGLGIPLTPGWSIDYTALGALF